MEWADLLAVEPRAVLADALSVTRAELSLLPQRLAFTRRTVLGFGFTTSSSATFVGFNYFIDICCSIETQTICGAFLNFAVFLVVLPMSCPALTIITNSKEIKISLLCCHLAFGKGVNSLLVVLLVQNVVGSLKISHNLGDFVPPAFQVNRSLHIAFWYITVIPSITRICGVTPKVAITCIWVSAEVVVILLVMCLVGWVTNMWCIHLPIHACLPCLCCI